jgi:hypothetical protein
LRLDITTPTPRNFRAGSLAPSRWRLSVTALVHWHCRAGTSALATLLRWRICVSTLVDVGITALLAQRERALDGTLFFFFLNGCIL